MEKNDHDLLITINTKLEQVISDVKDLKTNTVGRVEQLEINKADKKDLDALWKATNGNTNKIWWIIGIGGTIIAIAGLCSNLFSNLIH